MENPVIILGAQAVGTAALDAFLSNDVVVYCLLDDDPQRQNSELLDVPVMGSTDDSELLDMWEGLVLKLRELVGGCCADSVLAGATQLPIGIALPDSPSG